MISSFVIKTHYQNGDTGLYGPSTKRKLENLLKRKGFKKFSEPNSGSKMSVWTKGLQRGWTMVAHICLCDETKNFPDFK